MLNSQLYNLTASTSLPLVIAGVGAFVVIIYFFYSIFSIKRIKKRNEKYIDQFESVYEEKKSIRITLESLESMYSKKSMEYKAIKKALYYLDHSLFRDYAGALQIIDKIFESKKIKKMHDSYLRNEENKVLCLEDKNAKISKSN
jgi:hypothetical protein